MKRCLMVLMVLVGIVAYARPTSSMLAAKNCMLNTSKQPPYDAEVEYIDSIVPAFIDTGIKPSPSCTVELDGLWLSAGANSLGTIMGCYNDRYAFRYRSNSLAELYVYSRGTAPGFGTWIVFNTTIKNRHVYTYGANGVSLDGNVLADETTSTTVFVNYGNTLKIAGYNATNSQRGGNCRYWGVKIWKDGAIVRDFQPVRYTNENGEIEGAMYDRVSGTLFKNANVGKGTFSVGPDK